VKEKVQRVVVPPKSQRRDSLQASRSLSEPLEKVGENKVYHAEEEMEEEAEKPGQEDPEAQLEAELAEEEPARPTSREAPTEEPQEALALTASTDPLAVTTLVEPPATEPPASEETPNKNKKKTDVEPRRPHDIKGPKLKELLEAREVLEDAHLLSAQRSGEVRSELLLKIQANRSTELPVAGDAAPLHKEITGARAAGGGIQVLSGARAKPSKIVKNKSEKWNWEEWKTWSAYSRPWTAHWKQPDVPLPDAPYETHWLANPYLGHSPYQPWLNALKTPHPKGVKKSVTVPSLLDRKVPKQPSVVEVPMTGLETYDAKVRKLIKQSAAKAAAHYLAGLYERKSRQVLQAMDMPLAADSQWSYSDEYKQFEKEMMMSEQLVAMTAKRQPQTMDPELLRFQSADAVPLFSHFVPEQPLGGSGAGGSENRNMPVYY
jgi:hypothetical protein